MGELFAHPRLSDVPMKRVSLTESEQSRFDLRKGDLLFARRSLVAEGAGKCTVVMEVNEPTTFESSIIRARPDLRQADSLFLYYLFSSPIGKYLLGSILRHVAVAGITGSDLGNLVIPLPPMEEQQSIVHVLNSLDEKIELNRRMNETLETMARALFKSWFVDFDPVHAKAERRDPGLPAHIAHLFPDCLVKDSELGEIPSGWQAKRLGDTLNVLETGSRPKGGVRDIAEGVPSVGAESIVGLGVFDYAKTRYVPTVFFEAMKKGHVEDFDVLLYKDGGRPGEFEPHATLIGSGFPFSGFCINEHVYRLRCDPVLPQPYLYFWLTSYAPMEEMRVKGTGVAIPGLNSSAVRSLSILIPPAKVLQSFDESISPIARRILSGCNQSRCLAELRDALLPRLISGEIRTVATTVAGVGVSR